MAHSKNFFGMRRGSTKSHTYQVLHGQQVTKDRVYDVSNPQSYAQMQQRLKLPLVSNARAILKTLVNHSFEGVEYGYRSLHEFSSANLMKNALTISSYVPKGAMDCGQANFIISRGSLPSLQLGDTYEEDGVYIENLCIPVIGAAPATGSELTSAQIKAMIEDNNSTLDCLQLEAGDQITFLLAYDGSEYAWKDSGGREHTAHYHRFVISRLILDPDDLSKTSNWKWQVNGNDMRLSDGFVLVKIGNEKGDVDSPKVQIMLDTSKYNGEACMATAILSRKEGNTWSRSSQRLKVLSEDDVSYDDVVSTYMKSEGNSQRYLNSGIDSVDITGGGK